MKKPKLNITVSFEGSNKNLDNFYKINNSILKHICEMELFDNKKEQ